MYSTPNQSLRKWTLIKKKTEGNVLTLGEPQQLTMPKRNAEFWAKSKCLCIFTKSLNLMDLALE
ncbi:hypothetical protein EL45_15290 [Cellulophaga sp. E6(2014)]|nr:hypothetical protein EL45_15290 [Cellulophaga sp. E6(2014)]